MTKFPYPERVREEECFVNIDEKILREAKFIREGIFIEARILCSIGRESEVEDLYKPEIFFERYNSPYHSDLIYVGKLYKYKNTYIRALKLYEIEKGIARSREELPEKLLKSARYVGTTYCIGKI